MHENALLVTLDCMFPQMTISRCFPTMFTNPASAAALSRTTVSGTHSRCKTSQSIAVGPLCIRETLRYLRLSCKMYADECFCIYWRDCISFCVKPCWYLSFVLVEYTPISMKITYIEFCLALRLFYPTMGKKVLSLETTKFLYNPIWPKVCTLKCFIDI